MSQRNTHKTAVEKILARSKPDGNGCLIWTGAKTTTNGYGRIGVCNKLYLAHRLIYAYFKEEPGDLCVCHTCDNPACVNVDHLWLGTNADNVRDRNQKGRSRGGLLKGEDCPWAKLTSEDIADIRDRYVPRSRTHNQYALAKEFGVCQGTISDIVNRKRWAHI